MRLFLTIILFWAFRIHSAHAQDFNITDFGAENDSLADTQAIQAAIDRCSKNGGGQVVFPAGRWLSGTIYLKSNITIYLSKGAVWQGLNDDLAYPYQEVKIPSREDKAPRRAFIYAYQQENISILGEGTIYPGGDYSIFQATPKTRKALYQSRPFGLYLIDCQNIRLDGITLKNSAFWMFRALHCDFLKLTNLTVYNHSNYNNDGLDIDGCKEVIISNCQVDTSDDAIVLKSEGDRICENVTVTNCVLSSFATPLKCGTGSVGGYRNIAVSNIVIRPPRATENNHELKVPGGLSGIDLLCVDGGIMENISIDNVIMDSVETPLFIKLGNRNSAWPEKTNFVPGTIRNIRISNVTATNSGAITSSITGYEGNLIENVTLSNMRFESVPDEGDSNAEVPVDERSSWYPFNQMYGRDYPVYGLYTKYVNNLTLDNLEFVKHETDTRPALYFEETYKSRLLQVRTSEEEYNYLKIDTQDKLELK